MKLIVPKYFLDFKCMGGVCPDNCCIGWDIRIDDRTLGRYESISGRLGEKIRRNIRCGEDGATVKLCESGRCPFLSEDNLCELITELGEEYISEICREHPRFYTPLGDRVFGGVGMSCDAAARLILSQSGEHTYEVLDAEGFESEICDEALLDEILRKKQMIVDKLLQKGPSLAKKLEFVISCATEDSEDDIADGVQEFISLYSSLEYMRDGYFDNLRSAVLGADRAALSQEQENYVVRALIYFIDRYLPSAAVFSDVYEKLAVAVASAISIYALIAAKGADFESAVKISREYSSEIEYSEENVAAIEDGARAVYAFARRLFT